MSERIKPGMPGYLNSLLATCKLEDPLYGVWHNLAPLPESTVVQASLTGYKADYAPVEHRPAMGKRLMRWHALGERIGTDEIARAWRGEADEPYREPY